MRYRNLDGSGPQGFASIFQWAVTDRLRGRRRRSNARVRVPQVAPDLEALSTPPAPGEGARLTWLGHASWLVQLASTSLLIDPVLGPHIFPRIRRHAGPGVPVDALPPIAASLVSHAHYDHLDLPTLRKVDGRDGAPVVSGAGIGGYLKKRRLQAIELDWWASTRIGPVTVHFVPAQHWSRRVTVDVNHSLWGGFVIEGGGVRLYHSGDTAYFDGFQEIGRRFPGLDAAMLPIGAYAPGWFMEKQHMNPEQAVQAFVDLGARAFLAMHWGTFRLTDEPLDEPPRRLTAEWTRRGLPADRCRVPAVGESVELRGVQV